MRATNEAETAPRRAPLPPRLHCLESGGGRPLLLIHGVAGSLRIFDSVVTDLEASFRVLRPDLLGYGHSPKPRCRYDLATHITALRETLRSLRVDHPVHLVGLSMGATLALAYARAWPDEVDGLVCIGLPYFSDPDEARRRLRVNRFTRLAVERPRSSAVVVPALWFAGRHVRALSRRFASIYTEAMARDALRASYRAFASSVEHSMVQADLPGLVAASGERRRLFLHGSADRWVTLETLRAALSPYRASELHSLDGVEHNTVVVAPHASAAAVLEHLLPRG